MLLKFTLNYNGMKEQFEKALEVLIDYYPAWSSLYNDSIEIWARELRSNTIELVCMDWTMNALELKEHQGVWLKYTIDMEDIGIITAEENLVKNQWNEND